MIGLYPDLLPKEYRDQLEYPERPPELTGNDLERALLSLIEYLTQAGPLLLYQSLHEVLELELVSSKTDTVRNLE